MKRYLRIAASAFFTVVCVSLAMMWIRSYDWLHVLYRSWPDCDVAAWSFEGQLILSHSHFADRRSPRFIVPWHGRCFEARGGFAELARMQIESTGVLGFEYRPHKQGGELYVPYWFLTLATACLAVASKRAPRWQVSLAEICALFTLAAVAAAFVAWVSRLPFVWGL